MEIGQWVLGRSPVGILVRVLLLIYIALNLFAYLFVESLMFPVPFPSYQDTPDIIKLTTRNQQRISALYLPNPSATYTILYSHGNGSDLGSTRSVLQLIQQLGFSVFAYDYQGYGTSEGKPSEQNLYHDVNAAYEYLTQTLKISPDRIILYGFSIGGGPSLDLATRQPVAGIILEGTFTSVFRVVTYLPILLFDRFRNLDKIRSIYCPILLIHGTLDQVIPFWHGKALYEAANPPKQFLPIEGAGHNNLIDIAGDRYIQAIRNFAEQVKQSQTKS